MFLELSEIPDEGLDIERELDRLDPPGVTSDEAGGASLARPARLVARARSGERGVELSGRVKAELRLECSRCLDMYDAAVDSEFFLILVGKPAGVGQDDLQLEPADTTLFHVEGGRADLRALVREQIYLCLPLKPICREDCAGLCATCGVNRNRIECRCPAEQLDSRLAPLLDWKRSQPGPGASSGADETKKNGEPET